ncbi:MAG: putative lipid II flippase FtsW [Clostridia bacterium]|nr:putative lipid II flippase FtsW [Clostridia bacterium]
MEQNISPIKFTQTQTKRRRRTYAAAAHNRSIDFPLFLAVCAIALFGLVMLYSATYYKGIAERGDSLAFVKGQIKYVMIGIVEMYIISVVPYKFYKNKLIVIGIFAAIILMLVATLAFGQTYLGARRWIQIGGFEFQPSELVKIGLIVLIAAYMSAFPDNMPKFFKGICAVVAIIALPCTLIYLQPNMSTIIIIVAITGVMLFMGGAKLRYFIASACVGVPAVILVAKTAGYRSDRFTAWRDPFADPSNLSYQVVQSMYAFANGGFFGQGFNNSRQKLLFLPEMENDYVLSIIAEELGFIGVVLLILAYCFVIYRGIRIAMKSEDRFAALVAGGITSLLAIQVLINIGVVTNSIPATGQPLPFVSAGGTSLLVLFGAMGILLNISRFINREKKPLFGTDK